METLTNPTPQAQSRWVSGLGLAPVEAMATAGTAVESMPAEARSCVHGTT